MSATPEPFFEIALLELQPDTTLTFDLYLRHPGRDPVLFRTQELTFTSAHRERLLQAGSTVLLAPIEQRGDYERYREQHASGGSPDRAERPVSEPPADSLADREIDLRVLDRSRPLVHRCLELIYASDRLLRAVLADLSRPRVKERVHQVADTTARLLLREPEAYVRIVEALQIDFETYSHSSHTALYSIALARRSGIDSPHDLTAIGRAALLHDVGDSGVHAERWHTGSSFRGSDWQQVEAHVERGAALLRQHGLDDPLTIEVCLTHHERCDGSGHPRGLTEAQIAPAARIVMIADVFDAMTSAYPARAPLSGFQALWKMKYEMAGQFDGRLVDRFVGAMLDASPEPPVAAKMSAAHPGRVL
ncbi:MAG: HD domain-containing protein [Acidobacteriota bacterium]|nr:MAG: HD domain-containing protein [Acidobacteriota bacterium]